MYKAIIERKQEVFIPSAWRFGAFILISLPTYFFDKVMLLYTGEFLDKLIGVKSHRKGSFSSQISD